MSDNFEERLRAALHADAADVQPPDGLWAETKKRMIAVLGPRHLAQRPRRTVVWAGAAALIAVVAVAALARGNRTPTAAPNSPSPLVVDSASASPYPIVLPPTPSPAASPAAPPSPPLAPSPSPTRTSAPSPLPTRPASPRPAPSPSPATQRGGPVVTAISPASGRVGGGTTVGISGAGFSSGSAIVMFGQVPSPEVAVDSDAEIIAIAPPHAAGQVPVTVQVAGVPSNESPSALFTYVPGP